MVAQSEQQEPAPPSSPAPWWARALSGAIVGALAGFFLAMIIAAIALFLTLILPGVGAARIWRAAATVMAVALVASIIRSVWYGVRSRSGDSAP